MLLDLQTDEKLIAQLFGSQPGSVVWFASVFQSTHGCGNLVADFDAKYCNTTACRTLGAEAKDIIGKSLLPTNLVDQASISNIYEQCLLVSQAMVRCFYLYFQWHNQRK